MHSYITSKAETKCLISFKPCNKILLLIIGLILTLEFLEEVYF